MHKNSIIVKQVYTSLLLLAGLCLIESIEIRVTPSPTNDAYPMDSCITLSHFAAHSANYEDSNISLLLLQGNHSLNSTISLENLNKFQILTAEGANTVIITCTESVNLSLHQINEVNISGVEFIGCQGSRFESIAQLFLKNLTFISLYSTGAALEIVDIRSVHIARSFFISNSAGNQQSQIEFLEFLKGTYTFYSNIETQAKVGGALIISHSNVNITESQFEGNSAQLGGAIYSQHSSSITVRKCNFTQNYVHCVGTLCFGGVMVINSGCSLNIHSSIFWNNTNAGVIILLSATAYVTRSNFSDNSGKSGGVFVLFESSVFVERCIFHRNTAMTFGGVVYSGKAGIINITESLFDQNVARYGGVIRIDKQSQANVESSIFARNHAEISGGVLYTREGVVNTHNSTFKNNTAYYGAALYQYYCNTTVHYSTFYNNMAYLYGAVLYIPHHAVGASNVLLSNNYILGNRAEAIGGALFVYQSNIVIHNNTFSLNSAAASGGVIYGHIDSKIYIEKSTFTHNMAQIGILKIHQGHIRVNGSTFDGNIASSDGGIASSNASTIELFNSTFINSFAPYGGVLYTENTSVFFHDCICSHNQATNVGGIIFALQSSSIVMSNSILVSNSAGQQGGVASIHSGVLRSEKSTFMNNTGGQLGGVLTIDQATSNLTKNRFVNNSAQLGGAIYNFESNVNIQDSIFENNSAELAGALYVTKNSNSSVVFCIFIDNKAVEGGVYVVQNYSILIVDGSLFCGNSATSGGVAHINDRGTLAANGSAWLYNRAESGGAIVMLKSKVFLTHCTIKYSRADEEGGVVYARTNSSINLVGSTFGSNHASSHGGVLNTALNVTINMDNCTFFNNSAHQGGTIFLHNGNITSLHCTFLHNIGDSDGAVLYAQLFAVENFTSCTFLGNRAGEHGGVLSLNYRNTITLENCNFEQNSATYDGGVMYGSVNANIFINNSTFTNNTVGSDLRLLKLERNGTMNENNSNSDRKGGVIFVYDGRAEVTSSTFVNNVAEYGGVLYVSFQSVISIRNCTSSINVATKDGGVILSHRMSTILVEDSIFNDNVARQYGGVLSGDSEVTISINGSTIINNYAENGGALYGLNNNITIYNSYVCDNRARSGVLNIFKSTLWIIESHLANNSASYTGGTITIEHATLFIWESEFMHNSATQGGVIYAVNGSILLDFCNFHNNTAKVNGGVIYAFFDSNLCTCHSNFSGNKAGNDGAVIFSLIQSTLEIGHGYFLNNHAGSDGGVFFVSFLSFLKLSTTEMASIAGVNPIECRSERNDCNSGLIMANNFAERGAVIFADDFSIICIDENLDVLIQKNTAQQGIFYIYESTLNSSAAMVFDGNVEGVHFEKSTAVFTGITSFINSSASGFSEDSRGGAITSIKSDVVFDGSTKFQENRAGNGAAIHATESNVTIIGETVVTKNMAAKKGGGMCFIKSKLILLLKGYSKFTRNHAQEGGAVYSEESFIEVSDELKVMNNTARDGGGFHLYSSTLNLNGNTTIVGNRAEEDGGGILVQNSSIVANCVVKILNNEAYTGGGFSLSGQSKLYQDTEQNGSSKSVFYFTSNIAELGGALFISDENIPATCANDPHHQIPSAECFFFSSMPFNKASSVHNFKFSQNVATISGDDQFGGLLDRCTAKRNSSDHRLYDGLSSFQEISGISNLESVGSHPVRVCFCSNGYPNCSFRQPIIEVKSGEEFSLQLAALDQANHVVNSTIHTLLKTAAANLGLNQLSQPVSSTCTELSYNVFSPLDYEELSLYADGPCGSVGISKQTVQINIIPCSCPIGFQIATASTHECVCGCDSVLAAYVSECDHSTKSVIRTGNYWLTYINTTTSTGYLVYPNCPHDYCHLPTLTIKINLNNPNGSDAQCTSNKAGLLCGACRDGLSLSLGSSRCISCPNYWSGIMILILLFSFAAGIGLVIVLLVLNLTVAIGTINGFIFYANIVEAYKTTFFPSSTSSASIIVSWLNLEPGFDVCLFQGMDKYTKTWLQLVFPTYVIVLVAVIILITQHSTRFSELVGKKNPVAALATLILLSYAKLIQTVITVLSFATLEYPDGSRKTVWLPDATVVYFNGKHSVLVLVAIFILVVGVFFTLLLFSWQWLLRLPERKYLKWITHQKIHFFMETYNAPYHLNHRYWTGLLLLVRVILYFTSALNVSGDPRVTYMTLMFISGGLIAGKWILKGSIYKKWHNDFLEGVAHINLLLFTAFSWYAFETGKNQSVVSHISVTLTLMLLILVIIYHIHTETAIFKKLKKHFVTVIEKNDSHSPADEPTEGSGLEHRRRSSAFSVVEVPKLDKSSLKNSEEKEGLASIEFHDQDKLGMCFVNPLYMNTIGEVDESGELTNETQADLILDELGVRDED